MQKLLILDLDRNVNSSFCYVPKPLFLSIFTSLFFFNLPSAVAVNGKLQYAVIEVQSFLGDASAFSGNKKQRLGHLLKKQKRSFLVVASDLVPKLEAKWGVKLVVKKTLVGSDLENCRFDMRTQFSIYVRKSSGIVIDLTLLSSLPSCLSCNDLNNSYRITMSGRSISRIIGY